jgi:D-amino-acid dehydrogenase
MKVVVLGGGVVGVATAWFLAQDGHEVEVVERHDRLAQDASSGNAGLIAPGHSFAWASPAAPKMLVQSLAGGETAIRVKPRVDPALIRWGLRFLRECPPAAARRNTLVKLRLCQYSQSVMDQLAADEAIDYGARAKGVLYLYRDEAELEAGMRRMALLQEHGQEQELLDADGVARHEPSLQPVKDRIAGAVLGKTDSSGDSELFTNELAARCEKLGVRIRLGCAVHRLETAGDRVTGAVIDGGTLRADAYVLALGVDSPRLARTAGQRLPIYPAKGYSVTFPIREGHRPPAYGGVDEGTLVAWSSFGDRLRMSSTAEFAGHGRDWAERDFNNIMRTARELFPEAADYEAGRFRACLRPMTPDGPPILGYGRQRNLLYNTGHGHMGWTMACGTAKIAADLMGGRTPELPLTGMEVRR